MEDNRLMKDSYILLNAAMQFENHEGDFTFVTDPILEVGVHKAFKSAGFNYGHFIERDGNFFNEELEENKD